MLAPISMGVGVTMNMPPTFKSRTRETFLWFLLSCHATQTPCGVAIRG
jgi:hypothetical protein